jgi:hypothetical protein
MTRIDDRALALHLEVGLAVAPEALWSDFHSADRQRRAKAFQRLSEHLAERMRSFRFEIEEERSNHPSLFFEEPYETPSAPGALGPG